MSRRSDAKKARRKKRLATRAPRWNPDLAPDDDLAAVDEALTERGWEFDVDHSTDELATWFYPPSGIDIDDESVESVTRLWLTEDEEWHVILVGAGPEGVDYVFSADALLDHLETVEAYRHGHADPSFE